MSRDAFLVAVGIMVSCAWIGPAQALGSVESGAPGGERIFFQEIPSVHGASKYEQKVSEAPASVTIVTADDIRRFGWRTIADALRSVKGFYTTYDRAYTYAGVRGFGRPGDFNTRILLLVDGYRVNNNTYDQAFVGNGGIVDLEIVERIEVIPGPGSSLYGTNAFFAVVNVITKRGRDLKGGEISAEEASFGTTKGRASWGNRWGNGLEVLLSASALESEGQRLYFREYDDPSTNNGIAERDDDERAVNLLAKVSFGDFALSAGRVTREKTLPTGVYETVFGDPRTRVLDPQQLFVNLKFQRDLSDHSQIMLRGGYNTYLYDADYQYANHMNNDQGVGRWWTAEALLTRKISPSHKLVVGAEYQRNLQQDQTAVNEDGVSSEILSERRRSARWAVYLQDEVRVSQGFLLNLGVRYDDYDTFGGTTNPRMAVIYNAPAGGTTAKLLYGTAFRSPNVYEMYYNDAGFSQKTNPDLKPEKIETTELVLEQAVGGDFRASASLYRCKVKSLIDQETDPADGLLVFRNTGRVDARGIELEARGVVAGRVEGRASWAYQISEDAATGEALSNSPRHLAKLRVGVPIVGDKLYAGLESQFTSKRKTVSGGDIGGFAVSNLVLSSRRWIGGLVLTAAVYNLFDRKYSDPASDSHVQDAIPQDGRSFRLKATYEF
ncbi:MAG: TonB-dependent receptor [Nitrospirota bacterium]